MFGRSKAERDAAFTEFMASASPSLMRTAWLLCGDRELSRDLVQAALVKTYAAWSRVRPEEALAYARRILVNERNDRYRRGLKTEVPTEQLPDLGETRSDSSVEDRDQVLRLLATLPDQQRRVVVLRYYNDMSEADVARALGITVGSVKSAASRGLANLRAAAQLTNEGAA